MLKIGIIIFTLLSGSLIADERFRDMNKNSKEIGWMLLGIEKAKERLKDADSAKFKNVFFNKSSAGVPVACGEFNSKNSFGAYSGFKRFVFAGSSFPVILENDVSDFNELWIKLCK